MNARELDAVLAGLRLLQSALDAGTVTPNDGDIGDVLTCSGDHGGLTAAQIDELCERLNTGKVLA
jgi:hypothetical protein